MADRRDFLLGTLAAGAHALQAAPGRRRPALFVSHGAAIFTTSPDDATHRFLRGLEGAVSGWRPAALVVISAHFSGLPVRVTGPGELETLHDHPARAVHGYRYPGRGTQALSERVRQVLARAGIDSVLDARRGLDHGAWVPLSLLHPHGEVPVAQLSLDARAGADEHLALGRALAPLRDEGVLLVGSGGVTHNQDVFRQGFFRGADATVPEPFSRQFDAWVSDVLTSRAGTGRSQALRAFGAHPLAGRAHPTPEHLLPLLVMVGAAEDEPARKLFEGFQHSLSTSAFQLG